MADTIATAYVQIEPTFNGVAGKLKKELGDETEKQGKEAGGKFGSGFASVIGTAGKVMAGAVAAGASVASGIVASATESYSEYEQLVGGVETLFGDSANQVIGNAEQAFKTAGLSMNDYMETSIQSAASLINSLGGDQAEAARLMDMSITDMADNVNKMGTSMEGVQNAYRGFSRGNFTMLDNLALGFAGTKEGMQELLDKAQDISGVKYDISSYADIVQAIHVVQDEMGITGTTSREASETIQGSLSAMESAWDNLLTGLGDKDADLSKMIDNLVGSAETFLQNMMPVAEQALTGISTLVANLAPVLAEKIPGLLQSVLPMLLTSGVQIIETLGQGILQAIPALMPTITDLIIQLANMLIELLPQLIEIGFQVILSLALGIAEALPELVPTIIDVVLSISLYLLENIDILIDAAGQLIIGLAVGLVNAIPILIEKVPLILDALAQAFITAGAKLLEVGKELINIIKKAIDTYGPILSAKAQQLIADIKAKMMEKVKAFIDIGKNIVEGIKKGISNAWESFTKWVLGLLDGMVDNIVKFFKIGSPSKLMADKVGQWIPAGVAEGIQNGMGVLDDTIANMNSEMLETAINPTVMSTYMPSTTEQSDPLTELMGLLRTYLPQIADADTNVVLEGDADRLFRAVQTKARQYKQTTGQSAFA